MVDKSIPVIGITMGDAAGIGPEIIVKSLSEKELYEICSPIVIGDIKCLKEGLKVAKTQLELNAIKNVSEGKYVFGTLDIIDLDNIRIEELVMGKPQAMTGKAAFEYIFKAAKLALAGAIDAIVTAPISKESVNMSGCGYPGHTEILASLTGAKSYAMMLTSGPLRVVHVTTHVSLRDACDKIKKQRVLEVLRLTNEAMLKFGFKEPKIAVAGLNPHAGEGGLFGDEEIKEIRPAIEEAKSVNLNVIGPLPSDTVFYRALKGEFNVVVVMYHDQGHIPIKLLGFEKGVNITLGLSIIRTSVDHGTAYGRAGRKAGTADPSSLIEAIRIAAKLSSNT